MFKNISPAHIPQTGIQVRDTQNAPSNEEGTPAIVIPQMGMQNGSVPSNEEASRRYAESIPSANIPKGMQAQLARNAPSTISVAQLLAGVKDRNGKPLSEADEREFIIKPDGNRDFGRITEEVERATNGELTAAPIRLQVGNAEFGYKHLLNHLKQCRVKGLKAPLIL